MNKRNTEKTHPAIFEYSYESKIFTVALEISKFWLKFDALI